MDIVKVVVASILTVIVKVLIAEESGEWYKMIVYKYII